MCWDVVYMFMCYVWKKMEGFGSGRIERGCVTFDTPSHKKRENRHIYQSITVLLPVWKPCPVRWSHSNAAGNLRSNWRISLHN